MGVGVGVGVVMGGPKRKRKDTSQFKSNCNAISLPASSVV